MHSKKLAAVYGIGAGVGNVAVFHAGDFQAACVDAGFGYGGAAVNRQAVAIDGGVARFHAVEHGVGRETECYRAVRAFGCGEIGAGGNHVLHGTFGFLQAGFGGGGQIHSVIGNVAAVFGGTLHTHGCRTCRHARAVGIDGVDALPLHTLAEADAGNVGAAFQFGFGGGREPFHVADVGGVAVGVAAAGQIADAAAVDNGAAVDGEAVGSQIRRGGNGDVLAAVGDGDVAPVFERHGVARFHGFVCAAVGVELPAAADFFNRIVHGVFARVADVAHAQFACVAIQCGIAAEDVFGGFGYVAQHVLREIKLAAVDGIGAGGIDAAGGNVGNGALLPSRADADGGNGRIACKTSVFQPVHLGFVCAGCAVGGCARTKCNVFQAACRCAFAYGHGIVGRSGCCFADCNGGRARCGCRTSECRRCPALRLGIITKRGGRACAGVRTRTDSSGGILGCFRAVAQCSGIFI